MRVFTRANAGTIALYEFQVWKEETGNSTERGSVEVTGILCAENNVVSRLRRLGCSIKMYYAGVRFLCCKILLFYMLEEPRQSSYGPGM